MLIKDRFISVCLIIFFLVISSIRLGNANASESLEEIGRLRSDVNSDGYVNIIDLSMVASAWGSFPSHPKWNFSFDLNLDDEINILDLVEVTKDYGKSWTVYHFNEKADLDKWQVVKGNWNVTKGLLEGFSNGEGLIYAREIAWENFTLTAKVKIAADSPRLEGAIAFGLIKFDTFYWAGLGCWRHETSISKMNHGVPQELIFNGNETSIFKDVWYVITIKVSSDTMTLSINNSLELTLKNSSFANGKGFIGIRPYDSHLFIDYISVSGFASLEDTQSKRLYADGTKLRDASGREVYLKSVAIHVSERRDEKGLFWTIEDVKRIKNAGGNCIELHSELISSWMWNVNQINEDYFFKWLDREVSWCEKEEIYCIVNLRDFGSKEDWMRTEEFLPSWLWKGLYPYSYPLTEEQANQVIMDFYDPNVQKQEFNRQAWIEAWKFVANRYKNNEYVLFNLLNEPFAQIKIPNQEKARILGEGYAILMEKTIDAIRSVGAEQLIIIDWPHAYEYQSFTFNNVLKIQKDIVWESHHYVTSFRNLQQFEKSVNEAVQKFVYEFGQPLFVGEYGMYSPVKPSNWQYILVEEIAYLNKSPLCGRSWYEWSELAGEKWSVFSEEESEWILQKVFGP